MNKDQLEAELKQALDEIVRLSNENQRLKAVATNSNDSIRAANDLAEKYHFMLDYLINLITTQYDSEFKTEDIPKLPS